MTRDLYSPLVLYIYHLSITLGEISMNNILDNYLFDAFAAASDNIYIYVNDMKQNISRCSNELLIILDLKVNIFITQRICG